MLADQLSGSSDRAVSAWLSSNLSDGEREVMYESHALAAKDMPMLEPRRPAFLFLEVDDLDAVAGALSSHPVFLPRRETFYGATEIGFRYNSPT